MHPNRYDWYSGEFADRLSDTPWEPEQRNHDGVRSVWPTSADGLIINHFQSSHSCTLVKYGLAQSQKMRIPDVWECPMSFKNGPAQSQYIHKGGEMR